MNRLETIEKRKAWNDHRYRRCFEAYQAVVYSVIRLMENKEGTDRNDYEVTLINGLITLRGFVEKLDEWAEESQENVYLEGILRKQTREDQ